ncbi:MAG: hypothetical protein KIT81_12035 [Alphaproteobacteria bacterium]|nr:hypothetical protein [Alphaproteobacteria bacterium]
MTAGSERPFRRIVAALDATSDSGSVLDTAAMLAARWRVELLGLYLEDMELLQLCAHPVARQVGFAGGPEPQASAAQMQAALRVMERRAARLVQDAATHRNVASSFQVLRGRVASAVAALEISDLLVVQPVSRPFAGYLRVRSAWSESTGPMRRQPVLLVGGRPWGGSGVTVFVDASIAAERALAVAGEIAGPGAPILLVRAEGAPAAEALTRHPALAGHAVHAIALGAWDESRAGGMLVVPTTLLDAPEGARLARTLERPPCPVMLVG